MRVTPSSRHSGCWDQSGSACAGNPSSWGTLAPGFGGWSGSALLECVGCPRARDLAPWEIHPLPRSSSPAAAPLLAAREAVTEVLPTWVLLPGVPEPKGSVGVSALPKPGNL